MIINRIKRKLFLLLTISGELFEKYFKLEHDF